MIDEKVKSKILTVIIIGVLFFSMFRPLIWHLNQRLDFLIFLIENGLLLENIFLFKYFRKFRTIEKSNRIFGKMLKIMYKNVLNYF